MTNDPGATTPTVSRSRDAVVASLIGPVLLVLAGWFLWGPDLSDVPSTEAAQIDAADISSDPWRAMMPDPPTMQVAGFTKKCSECHDLFTSDPDTPLRLNQHRNIVQAHGMNDRCYNCHDRVERTRLVLPGGKTVGFGEVERLCATCHGPTFRDWERGIHGRTNGYWNTDLGPQVRLTCTQCHDPHAPAFGLMSALPGPDTLRMGDPAATDAHAAPSRNPLRRWSNPPAHGEETDTP